MVTPIRRLGTFAVLVLCLAACDPRDVTHDAKASSTRSSAVSPTAQMPSSTSGSPSASAPGSADTGKPDDRGRGAGEGNGPAYEVVSVVDGDTIKVTIDGAKETVRIIGLDTPETKKPRVPAQCFGKEASSNMQSLVQSKRVQLVVDSPKAARDRYGRLLRHVFVDGSTNVALAQIEGGFGREYTYRGTYQHRLEYLAAQNKAKTAKRGTWGPPCNGFHTGVVASGSATPSTNQGTPASPTSHVSGPKSAATSPGACLIKGNISASGERVAHAPGSAAYERTKITASKGERMFCSEAEAIAAGWRMAGH